MLFSTHINNKLPNFSTLHIYTFIFIKKGGQDRSRWPQRAILKISSKVHFFLKFGFKGYLKHLSSFL